MNNETYTESVGCPGNNLGEHGKPIASQEGDYLVKRCEFCKNIIGAPVYNPQ